MLAVGLGEILVAVADLLGHVDIFDVLFGAERRIGRHDQVAEAARMTGADIEAMTRSIEGTARSMGLVVED